MDHADPGASQHGDDLFGYFRQIDGDTIALPETKLFEGVGAAVHLSVQFSIGEDSFLIVFTDPDQCDFVLAPGFDVAIQAVIGDVAFCADKPLRPWIIPLQDFLPRREPLQLFGGSAPKCFRVCDRLFVLGLVVFDIGCSYRLRGRLVRPTFLQQGLDLFAHGGSVSFLSAVSRGRVIMEKVEDTCNHTIVP